MARQCAMMLHPIPGICVFVATAVTLGSWWSSTSRSAFIAPCLHSPFCSWWGFLHFLLLLESSWFHSLGLLTPNPSAVHPPSHHPSIHTLIHPSKYQFINQHPFTIHAIHSSICYKSIQSPFYSITCKLTYLIFLPFGKQTIHIYALRWPQTSTSSCTENMHSSTHTFAHSPITLVSICSCIQLFVFIHPSAHPSAHPSTYTSISPPICLPFHLFTIAFICIPNYSYIRSPAYSSICLPIYQNCLLTQPSAHPSALTFNHLFMLISSITDSTTPPFQQLTLPSTFLILPTLPTIPSTLPYETIHLNIHLPIHSLTKYNLQYTNSNNSITHNLPDWATFL